MEKKEIIERLIFACPTLKEDIKEYCKDFSEIYLHLVFGDIFNPYMLQLLDDVQKKVYANHNTMLEPEIIIIGEEI